MDPFDRRCPYCVEIISLADCPIVATNVVTRRMAPRGPGLSLFDHGDPGDEAGPEPAAVTEPVDLGPTPVSGAPVLGRIGGRPIVAPAPSSLGTPEVAWSGDHRMLLPANQLANPRDLPARACVRCHEPLPVDLDDREVHIIAVVGTQGAGKTHYLAAALQEARSGGLVEFGYRAFYAAESSEDDFHRRYYGPVYEQSTALPKTEQVASEDVRLRPLVFRAELQIESPKTTGLRALLSSVVPTDEASHVRRLTFLFHDIAGESLRNPADRDRVAPFLRHASGYIFLVDPMGFAMVRDAAARTYPGLDATPPAFSQAGLINALTDKFGLAHADVPVAVAITKSDLVNLATGQQHAYNALPPVGLSARLTEMLRVSDEVRHLIAGYFGDSTLEQAVGRLPSPTFHAIASLGMQPSGAAGSAVATIERVQPSRCLDPLISVLEGIR